MAEMKIHEVLAEPRLRCPFTLAIIGPSDSGKTTLTRKIIENPTFYCNRPFSKIFYIYKFYQGLFENMKRSISNIEFFPSEDLERVIEEKNYIKYYLVVLDDCDSLLERKDVQEMFSGDIKHNKTSLIFITHNIFPREKFGFDCMQNVFYKYIFPNCRDSSQISTLSRRVALSKHKEFLTMFLKNIAPDKRNPLILDCHAETPHHLMLRSNVHDVCQAVYTFEKLN